VAKPQVLTEGENKTAYPQAVLHFQLSIINSQLSIQTPPDGGGGAADAARGLRFHPPNFVRLPINDKNPTCDNRRSGRFALSVD